MACIYNLVWFFLRKWQKKKKKFVLHFHYVHKPLPKVVRRHTNKSQSIVRTTNVIQQTLYIHYNHQEHTHISIVCTWLYFFVILQIWKSNLWNASYIFPQKVLITQESLLVCLELSLYMYLVLYDLVALQCSYTGKIYKFTKITSLESKNLGNFSVLPNYI